MNPHDIAEVCRRNNKYRFDAILKWMKLFPDYWNINHYVELRESKRTNPNQCTCLIVASKFSDAYFVKQLLRLGANTAIRDSNYESPLFKAATSKIEPIQKARMLIAYKPSSVRDRNKNGLLPLHYAAKNSNPELVSVLLDQTNVNAQTIKLLTPLHVASHFGNVPAVRVFLKNEEINVNATDYCGDTPAHHSAHYGHLEVYTLLQNHTKYDPNVQNLSGLTVEEELFEKLSEACRVESEKRVIELVEKWKIPLKISRDDRTSLHQSCESNVDSVQKVRYLIHKQSSLISKRLKNVVVKQFILQPKTKTVKS